MRAVGGAALVSPSWAQGEAGQLVLPQASRPRQRSLSGGRAPDVKQAWEAAAGLQALASRLPCALNTGLGPPGPASSLEGVSPSNLVRGRWKEPESQVPRSCVVRRCPAWARPPTCHKTRFPTCQAGWWWLCPLSGAGTEWWHNWSKQWVGSQARGGQGSRP